MKIRYLAILLCAMAHNLLGQSVSFNKANSFYIEFLGHSATSFSVNYERGFYENNKSYISGWLGLGLYNLPLQFIDDREGFNIPFGLNSTWGKSNHHMEFGIGSGINHGRSIEKPSPLFFRMLFSMRVGYRFQKPSGGFLFRAGITPTFPAYYFYDNRDGLLEDLDLIFHLVGISVGYTFKNSEKR